MEIDLDALSHNVELVRQHVGSKIHLIAALKGDAYGHGIGPVAQRLARAGVHSVAIGSLRDAMAIRAAGVDLPILMFGGPLPQGIPLLLKHGLTPTVHDWTSALAVSTATEKPTPVYLKVDIGGGRLGIPLAEAVDFVHRLLALEHIVLEGLYTHITFGDAERREWARERYAAFDGLIEKLEREEIHIPVTQALASGGLMAGMTSRANAVCPGGILYGIQSPIGDDVFVPGTRPVITAIKSRIIHVATPGEPPRVGVAPIGMADGYRTHSNGADAHVLFRGRRLPITAVCLEYVLVDLSSEPDAGVGDEITLLGSSGEAEITLRDLATWQGCAPHETLLGFEGRLRAHYRE